MAGIDLWPELPLYPILQLQYREVISVIWICNLRTLPDYSTIPHLYEAVFLYYVKRDKEFYLQSVILL